MTDSSNSTRPFHVLFVDNSRTTRAAMSNALEEKNYEVTTAGTGMEAIEILKTGVYDLIIMDLYMPLMNGYEAAKLIRDLPAENCKNIPIIALTASNDVKDQEIAQLSGMNEFVVKTSDHKDLFEILAKYHAAISS